MSDGLNPQGPSQPKLEHAYQTAGNPTDKSAREDTLAQKNAMTDEGNAVAHRGTDRVANDSEAVPTSVARGVRGAPPGEERRGMTQVDMDQQELDAEQMGAPGEGKVDSAVQRKPGASGNEPGLESDIEKKKAEQAPAREAIKAEKQHNVDVGGILGQRGGPANPVDKNNYPNSGD
ncbi:hypothetical protein CERZMDRAFT_44455 [Cercospora zeae-maydis SCOH1-5]|uniref:Uncharacterized protein n=1 Tax=Cercospora zeae-maydis SCOH1-5 TaxID=717836 RepID=A0A6A6FBQ6_9PEZI|nr:hypothetical protein CERZMDRAFT_44455 [Cercospora zeae-maydis SCOH1-5]